MEPKTALQRLVVEVSSKLPAITEEQKNYGFDKCLPHFSVFTKAGIYSCLDCGHRWHNAFDMRLIGVQCPACNRELEVRVTRERTFKARSYYSVITAFKGFQILRVFMVYGSYKVSKPCDNYMIELYQVFVNEKGQSEIVGLFETSRYYDAWGGGFELRSKHAASSYHLHTKVIFTKSKIIPALKRNGYRGALHNLSPRMIFEELLSNPMFETLWKAKMYSVLKHYGSSHRNSQEVIDHFGALKICIRNKYKISDASMYFDYLNLLRFFGKDLHNAKFVCPDNLRIQHDKLVFKKTGVDLKNALTERKKKLVEDQKKYVKSKGIFFGICFIKENLCVKVIESVKDVIEEADVHKHCVYANRYFEKADSLLLSAKLDGRPLETVEFSLSKMQVIQARGLQNKVTPWHNEIIDLVNNNLNVIRERYREVLKTA